MKGIVRALVWIVLVSVGVGLSIGGSHNPDSAVGVISIALGGSCLGAFVGWLAAVIDKLESER